MRFKESIIASKIEMILFEWGLDSVDELMPKIKEVLKDTGELIWIDTIVADGNNKCSIRGTKNVSLPIVLNLIYNGNIEFTDNDSTVYEVKYSKPEKQDNGHGDIYTLPGYYYLYPIDIDPKDVEWDYTCLDYEESPSLEVISKF